MVKSQGEVGLCVVSEGGGGTKKELSYPPIAIGPREAKVGGGANGPLVCLK